MKIAYLALISTLFFFMIGCTTSQPRPQVATNFLNRQSVIRTTTENYPAKNPQNVAFYSHEKTPHTAYRVIGVAKVSKYNLLGVERHEDTMHNMMKQLAASVGGDGLIDVSSNKEGSEANIIAFQKILI